MASLSIGEKGMGGEIHAGSPVGGIKEGWTMMDEINARYQFYSLRKAWCEYAYVEERELYGSQWFIVNWTGNDGIHDEMDKFLYERKEWAAESIRKRGYGE